MNFQEKQNLALLLNSEDIDDIKLGVAIMENMPIGERLEVMAFLLKPNHSWHLETSFGEQGQWVFGKKYPPYPSIPIIILKHSTYGFEFIVGTLKK